MRTQNRKPLHGKNNNNRNNNFRRNNNNGGGNNNGRNRNANRFHQDEPNDFVTPHQRRHASNQQSKFLDLAKNARQAGDRVEYEYYMQHVEHYSRVLNLADEQQRIRDEGRRQYQFNDEHEIEDNEGAVQAEVDENPEDRQQVRRDDSEDHDVTEVNEEKIYHPRRERIKRQPRESFVDRRPQPVPSSPEEQAVDMEEPAQALSPVHKVMQAIQGRIESGKKPETQEQASPRRRGRPRKDATDPSASENNSGAALQHVLPKARMD